MFLKIKIADAIVLCLALFVSDVILNSTASPALSKRHLGDLSRGMARINHDSLSETFKKKFFLDKHVLRESLTSVVYDGFNLKTDKRVAIKFSHKIKSDQRIMCQENNEVIALIEIKKLGLKHVEKYVDCGFEADNLMYIV